MLKIEKHAPKTCNFFKKALNFFRVIKIAQFVTKLLVGGGV
jgi:hypothetical protein